MNHEAVEKAAENSYLKLAGRAVMVASLPMMLWIISFAAGLSDDIDKLAGRMTIVENTATGLKETGASGRNDRILFQEKASDKLDELLRLSLQAEARAARYETRLDGLEQRMQRIEQQLERRP